MTRLFASLALALTAVACISPSVVDPTDRARASDPADQVWRAAKTSDLPGVYVSTNLTGSLANVLRKVVYLFEADGTYTGAALVDGVPAHFEAITGIWEMDGAEITLDAAAAAQVEVSDDRSLRITGEQGQVILRRELDQ